MIYKMTLGFILTILFTTETYSQEHYFIRKKLVERGTNTAIPFANVTITNSTKGTAADAKGDFVIKIEKRYLGEKLKISCIGFLTRIISIDSVLNQSPDLIELSADINLLDELVIKEAPLDPGEIVRKAIESINDNYSSTPFNMEFYSEIAATDITSGKEFKLETILFGYYQGYSASKRIQFEILQRRATGEDHLKSFDYLYWPTFELHNTDQIAASVKHGILKSKNLDKFILTYKGASIFDVDTVYNIEYYAPKPTKEITGYGAVPKIYKGNIYITTNTYAIVKHEITTDFHSFLIIYKKFDEKYFPYFISGERAPNRTVLSAKVHNSLTLKNIESKNVRVIDYKTNEFDDANNVTYDEAYWMNNYPNN